MNRDRGSATVVVVFVIVFGFVMASLGVATMRLLGARGTAATAADLAALAAASAYDCSVAERVAAANGAATASCSAQGLDYVVVVSVDVAGLPGGPRVVTAMARAGPR